MTSKTYDDFQELNDTFDFIPAKELESRLDEIREKNTDEEDFGIFTDEIFLIESIIGQFSRNGDSISDLTRYSQFDRKWVHSQLEEIRGWNSDCLPEAVRNSIDWDDVKSNLLNEMNTVEIDGTTYYYEES